MTIFCEKATSTSAQAGCQSDKIAPYTYEQHQQWDKTERQRDAPEV